jgi:hypothetical protein
MKSDETKRFCLKLRGQSERFPEKKALMKHMVYSIPVPTIDIVPIPHPDIVEQRLSQISKIEELSFKIFALNSEMQVNDILRGFAEMSEQMGTSNAGGKFSNPTKKEKVSEFVKESKGLADLKMKAILNGNRIRMSTDDFVENTFVKVPDKTLTEQGKIVYSQLKDREELTTISDDNLENYRRYISKF